MLVNLGNYKALTLSAMTSAQTNLPLTAADTSMIVSMLPEDGDYGFLMISSQGGSETVKVTNTLGNIVIERSIEGVPLPHPKMSCVRHTLSFTEVKEISETNPCNEPCQTIVNLADGGAYSIPRMDNQLYYLSIRKSVGNTHEFGVWIVGNLTTNIVSLSGVSAAILGSNILITNNSGATAQFTIVAKKTFD